MARAQCTSKTECRSTYRNTAAYHGAATSPKRLLVTNLVQPDQTVEIHIIRYNNSIVQAKIRR